MKYLLFIFLIGCSTNKVNYRMPANRFNTPEVTGGSIFALDLKGRANLNYGASNRVSSSQAIGEAMGTGTAEASIEGASQLGARFDLSFLDRLDFYLNYAAQSPATGGFKWQFLGKTEEAFAQGWKSSIAAGYGHSDTGDQLIPIESAATSTQVSGSNELSTWDFNWHIGYRFPERLLLYLNVNYSNYDSEINFKTSTGQSISKNPVSDNWGIILGLQYYFKSKEAFLIAELGFSEGEVQNSTSNSITSFGLNVGWRFE